MAITWNNTYGAGLTGTNLTNVTNVVNAVEAFFNQQFSNTLTLNVTFDYQPLNVGYVSGGFTLGSNGWTTHTVSYATILNALNTHQSTSDANPGDDAALTGALPAVDPATATAGNTVQWNVSNGQEKLLGLNGVGPNDNLGVDASITLASDLPNGTFFDFNEADGVGANGFGAFGVLAHEISEGLMGRFMDGGAVFNDNMNNPTPFNNYSIMDLLHFTPGGTRAIVQPTAGGNILSFSGTTGDANLNRVLDNSGDIADPGSGADPRNSFADGQTGVINAITQTDLRILDVLGWTRINGLDDHNQSNTAATTVLTAGTTNGINGNIELQGDHDWFKVVLDPTKHYAITVEGAANGKGTLADPFVALYGGATPSRDTTVPLLTADDGGVGTNSLLLTALGLSGNFFVDVGSIGTAPESGLGIVQDIGQGTYRVTLIGNAAPVLSPDAGSPHNLTELAGTTNSFTLDQVSGTLSFTDADVGDTHTASVSLVSQIWSGGVTIPFATQAAVASAMTDSISVDGTAGSLAWQFSLADRNVDFLAVGEKLTAVYNVTVTDHHVDSPLSDSSTQQVTIVFTGTNDPVVVNALQSTLAGSINELPNVTGSTAIDTTSGVIAFSDVDLNDRPTATINSAGQTVTWKNAAEDFTTQLTAAQISLLEGAFAISAEAGNTNTGKIDWTYSIVDNKIDFLALGETITVTTPVIIDDHHGGAVSQNIVVTIIGANDPPAIQSGGGGDTATYIVNANEKSNAFTTIVATDPDHGDIISYQILRGLDSTLFRIDPDTGVLLFNSPSIPGKSYSVQVQATDQQGATDVQTITVKVVSDTAKMVGDAAHSSVETFVFHSHFNDTVTNFDLAHDFLQFDKGIFSADTAAAVLAAGHDTNKGFAITSSQVGDLTILGVSKADLAAHASDFVFA